MLFLEDSLRSVDREIIYWSVMFYSVQPESQQQACIPDVSTLSYCISQYGKAQSWKSVSCYCHSTAIVTLFVSCCSFLSLIFNMTINGNPTLQSSTKRTNFMHLVEILWLGLLIVFFCLACFALGHQFSDLLANDHKIVHVVTGGVRLLPSGVWSNLLGQSHLFGRLYFFFNHVTFSGKAANGDPLS